MHKRPASPTHDMLMNPDSPIWPSGMTRDANLALTPTLTPTVTQLCAQLAVHDPIRERYWQWRQSRLRQANAAPSAADGATPVALS